MCDQSTSRPSYGRMIYMGRKSCREIIISKINCTDVDYYTGNVILFYYFEGKLLQVLQLNDYTGNVKCFTLFSASMT